MRKEQDTQKDEQIKRMAIRETNYDTNRQKNKMKVCVITIMKYKKKSLTFFADGGRG